MVIGLKEELSHAINLFHHRSFHAFLMYQLHHLTHNVRKYVKGLQIGVSRCTDKNIRCLIAIAVTIQGVQVVGTLWTVPFVKACDGCLV